MKVQRQVPINNDKKVVLFFSLKTSKTAEGFVKKIYKTTDMVKYIFCMTCSVRIPMVRGTLEITCYS